MVAVGKIKMAENAPHVVLHVGVEELHRPPFDGRRKTAQHEYTRRGGQKGLKRMSFHIIGVGLRGSAEGWAGMIRQRTRSGELIRRMSRMLYSLRVQHNIPISFFLRRRNMP